MSRSQRQYLLDILKAMDAAESFVADMTFEELEGDQRTQYALQRAFEIIGEATKHLDDAVREAHPEIPWDTVHKRFPREKPRLQQLVDELPDKEE